MFGVLTYDISGTKWTVLDVMNDEWVIYIYSIMAHGSLIHIALNMTYKCKQMMFLFDETEPRNEQSIEMNRFLVFVFQMQEKISHFILLSLI